ncbi:single-stranded-DNA-specific exonuclease RecJ [Chlamydia sp. 17-3921]|uniref:single-stranded-DNA-specific exonuclease RecJ n=1 Tax=Chlamydia sp. 17-3921 TaxID=2675798 RepID=UPI001918E951|nr:single-stranded-DNA-specific exonuclease RecJ [Chlamydia sp. 17-3921]
MANNKNSSQDPLQWIYPRQDFVLRAMIIKEFHLNPIAAQIFVSRGFQTIEEIHNFLYSHLSNLYDPELFLDMSKAVDRLLSARERGEHVMIYGDSDVDGITGVALLVEFLQSIGIRVSYFFLGAMLKQHGEVITLINKLKEENVSLLITVDCGIAAGKEVNDITKEGIDVIVTDHHMPTGKIPHCIATLNPQLRGHNYPNRDLTGVGVAFKLARGIVDALIARGDLEKNQIDLKRYLDLVTLGTLTDMGVLLGENRVMVRYGLKEISKGMRLGLNKLSILSGVEKSEITSMDVVLKIAPKLNSLGRLSNPAEGVELLLTQDNQRADDLIKKIDILNRERQKIEAEVFQDIQKILAENPKLLKQAAIVLASSEWHARVIPIISARLSKAYNKPVVIIAIQGDIGKGSVRTIGSFPLIGVLKKCSSLFMSYGGHDFAAGIILKKEKINDFKKKFIHLVQSSLKKVDTILTLPLDAHVGFDEIDHDFLASLDLLEPFGKGNPMPIFYTKVRQIRYPKLLPGNHVKLFVSQGERNLEGIAFGIGERIVELKSQWHLPLELAYTPRIASSSSSGVVHLLIRDFRVLQENSLP